MQQIKKEDNDARKKSIDFHLEMIGKIDKILEENEKPIDKESKHSLEQNSFVEPRNPISKKVEFSDNNFKRAINRMQFKQDTTPDEFKSEFSLTDNPNFRFVNELDSPEELIIKNTKNQRIEILDISSLVEKTTFDPKTMKPFFDIDWTKNPKIEEKQLNMLNKENIELIDVSKLVRNEKTKINYAQATTKSKDIKTKREEGHVYYLKSMQNKKADKDSYIPVDFDEKAKIIKEKETKEEQKKLEKEKKISEKEEEKRRKAELKKQKQEEKQRKKEEKKRLKEQKKKQPKTKSKSKTKEEHNKEDTTFLDEDIKKLLLVTDELLGQLPEQVIEKFAKSEDFELYEKVMSKYKIK